MTHFTQRVVEAAAVGLFVLGLAVFSLFAVKHVYFRLDEEKTKNSELEKEIQSLQQRNSELESASKACVP
jgi:cell division protein FtsB